MKHKRGIALCLCGLLIALSGCSGDNSNPSGQFVEITQNLGPAVTAAPVVTSQPEAQQQGSIFAQNPGGVSAGLNNFSEEDALREEGMDYQGSSFSGADPSYSEPFGEIYTFPDDNATVYPYTGSTPIPLDPIDMPPPPPRLPVTFAYVPYVIASLGLNFEGPAGWVPDEVSTVDTFILTEPANQIKEGQLGVIRIQASYVTRNYNESNLKAEVTERLKGIGSVNFAEWKPSLTATRHLMGTMGVYANYSGTLANGVQVGGRIHCVCIDQRLYTIEITYPLGYRDDYLNAFSKMRETIKRQQ